jgi:hypothetical protein
VKPQLIALGLLLVSTRLLAGQEARSDARRGIWFSMGAGWGSADATCEVCRDTRFNGVAAYANGGGTLSRHVLLGAELNGWVTSETGLREQMTFVSAVGVFYPEAESGFFLKGGVGAVWYLGETGVNEITATAPAFVLGSGYQFPIGSGWFVVPFLNWFGTADAAFKVDGQSPSGDPEIRLNLFQLGIGFARP